ncbi:MAG: recombinase family protein [Nitrospira sp.]|nr:recombinase family protein [Nitrospira sp.]
MAGRLVLNVLLSFAQFEREVTGERIRDKIAASKKKGWWMGGVPPLGYDVQDRQLIINEQEAQLVQHIFRRYLTVGSVSALVQELRQDGTRTKVYRSRAGRTSGGRPFSRGHLYHLLHNRIYRGEIVHRNEVYPGHHVPIIDDELWQQTQALFKANHQAWHKDERVRTPFLLKGILFDAAGNRFSPMQGRKGSRAYRYYVNQVVLQFREEEHRQIRRMPGEPLEQVVITAVIEALKEADETHAWVHHVNTFDGLEQQVKWRQLLTRVEVSAERLRITVNPIGAVDHDSIKIDQDVNGERKQRQARVLEIPWRMIRRGGRTELRGQGAPVQPTGQPHEGLVRAMVRAWQWKDELVAGRVPTIKALAQREGLTRRYVMRVLRLSFLAPDIIERILTGRQPPDLTLEPFRRPIPLEWAAQRKFFGFPPL